MGKNLGKIRWNRPFPKIPQAGCKYREEIKVSTRFRMKKFPKRKEKKQTMEKWLWTHGFQHFSALSWIGGGGREGLEFRGWIPGISGMFSLEFWGWGSGILGIFPPGILGLDPWNFENVPLWNFGNDPPSIPGMFPLEFGNVFPGVSGIFRECADGKPRAREALRNSLFCRNRFH